MNGKIGRLAFTAFAAVLLINGSAQAEAERLSPDELARCANQVQQLRAESARLTQKNHQFDTRRNTINQRSAALATQGAAADANDLKTGLALNDSRQRHNQDTLAFNAEVEQLKREIVAVNVLKSDYDRGCSNRPYRRADLDRLPEPARNAMRTGLSDVEVPYLDPSAMRVAP